MRTAISRVRNESERLESLPGLPVEFWKTFDSCGLLYFALRAYEAVPPSQMEHDLLSRSSSRGMRRILLDKVGYEEVVKVDFVKMRLLWPFPHMPRDARAMPVFHGTLQ